MFNSILPKDYIITSITEDYIEGFHAALDCVARERKYLAFLEAPPLEITRAFVLKNINENRPCFVALYKNKVIGWCDITSRDRPVFVHVGVLGMGVVPDHRRRGIGEALIRAALNKAKLIGLTRVELTVRENNNHAIALYQKAGFVIEGMHRNAVRIEGQYENHISMGLLFE